jgi:trimethylamine--corrinoid protein Co-methyltransferase
MHQGGSSNELFYSPELSVMDDDVAGWIGRILEGPEVSDETLAIDVINQVGPIPGHYLGHAHTREWWQKENLFLQVTDTEPYSTWVTSGKKDMISHAKEKIEEILATHKPMPLTPEQEAGVEEVLKEAREYYRKRGMISDEEWVEYMRTLEAGD